MAKKHDSLQDQKWSDAPLPPEELAVLTGMVDRTLAQDENEGLAGKIVELRGIVEEHRAANIREMGAIKTEVGRIADRLNALFTKVDGAMLEWDRKTRALDQSHRDSAEQVRAAGEMARGMRDRMKVLDELRDGAADPHAIAKPLKREMGLLKDDLASLRRHVDDKFEALPRKRAIPNETRD